MHDAGRTQVEPNTPTVCAVGPCESVFIQSLLEGVTIMKWNRGWLEIWTEFFNDCIKFRFE